MHRIIIRWVVIATSVLLALAVGLVAPSRVGAAVAKPPPPTVNSFTASPISAYGYLGGPVTLTASVTNAVTCTLSANHFVSGLPATVDCSSGTVSEALTLPARPAAKPNPYIYKFKLRAVGSKAATGKVSVTVAGLYNGCSVYIPPLRPQPYPYAGCNLAGADLSNNSLSSIWSFQHANLIYANLSNDHLGPGNGFTGSFAGANLSFTNFSGTTLTRISSGGIVGTPIGLPADWVLIDGYLVGPTANLHFSYLIGVNLTGAHLAGADLSDSYLMNATLIDADLSNADLSGANLSGADLSGADLYHARLGGVVTGVTWSNTICPDGTNSDNDGGTCVNNVYP